MDTRVKELVWRKGSHVITIDEGETVYAAIATMVDKHVGSIIATREQEPVGIFTESDYMRRIVLCGRSSKTTALRDVMSPLLHSVQLDDSVQSCMRLMTEAHCGHLPVMDDELIVGMLSIGDCVAHLCREATVENDQLRDYISGRYPG